jgi:hypothetical protein
VTWGSLNPSNQAGFVAYGVFDDDGDRLLAIDNYPYVDSSQSLLRVVDPATAQVLNPDALGSGCSEPAWSADGNKIAAICGCSGGPSSIDSLVGDLVVADIDAASAVTGKQTIVPKGGQPDRPAWPSFSPDGELISFSRTTSGLRSTGTGKLWLVGVDGSSPTELVRASSDGRGFFPMFAPKSAGGYSWIVFVSRRDYGNELVGANRPQLWVAAIDDPPTGGDPSHPPFYLRGQQMCDRSENAFFALNPCKDLGASCLSGIECCDGHCLFDPQVDDFVCGEPGECVQSGNACTVAQDCCGYPTESCLQGFCQVPPPR